MGTPAAAPHQLIARTLLAGGVRLCDLALLAVAVLAARALGTEGFGVFLFGLTAATILITPAVDGLAIPVVQRAVRDPQGVGSCLGTVLPLQLVLGGGLLLLAWAAFWGTERWVSWTDAHRETALVMMGALAIRGPFESVRAAVRGLGRLASELGLVALERFLVLGLSAAILWRGGGPVALGLGFIAVRVVAVAVGLSTVQRLGHAIRWQVQGWRHHVAEALSYSLTFWIDTAFGAVGILSLTWFWNDAVTGTFGAAFRFFEGLCSISAILFLVLLPEVAARHALAPERIAPLVSRAMSYTTLLVLLLTAGLLVEAPLLVRALFGPGYGEAVLPLRILSLSFLGMFTMEIARTVLWAVNRPRAVLGLMASRLAAQIACALWLVPSHGAIGASVAVCVSVCIGWALSWFLLRRHGIPWPQLRLMAGIGLTAAAVFGALVGLRTMPWPVRLGVACLGGLIVAHALRIITAADWRLVRTLPAQLMGQATRS